MGIPVQEAVADLSVGALVAVRRVHLQDVCSRERVLIDLHPVRSLRKNRAVVVDVEDHDHDLHRWGERWAALVRSHHSESVVRNLLPVQLSREPHFTVNGAHAELAPQGVQQGVLNVAVRAAVRVSGLSFENNGVNRCVFRNVGQFRGEKSWWVVIYIQQNDGDLGGAGEPGGRGRRQVVRLHHEVVEGLALPVQSLEDGQDAAPVHGELPEAVPGSDAVRQLGVDAWNEGVGKSNSLQCALTVNYSRTRICAAWNCALDIRCPRTRPGQLISSVSNTHA